MDGGVGVVQELERGLGRDRTFAQQEREHEAGRCRADRGREQMLGIAQELEVRLGLWINAGAACQGVAVEGGACALFAEVAGDGRGQFLDRYRGAPQPKTRRDRSQVGGNEEVGLQPLDRGRRPSKREHHIGKSVERKAPDHAVGERWLIGLDLPPLAHGVIWSLSLNALAYVVFSLGRAPASIERVQADLFVPSDLTPIPPSFRLWRSSVTVEELTTTVSRYLGEERTRTSFDSYALTRGIRIDPKAEADFQLLRYAEHLLASAIGAASSRLVLSLLLRKRTVSTKAALKLLDDANAAIHYNREILQTALDHVRQGIAVFDKELHLVCWNRQFG